MPDFPLALNPHNMVNISTISPEAIGNELQADMGAGLTASTAWPSANLALYIPFEIYEPVTIISMSVVNGSAVSGNIDVGIYNSDLSRKVSIGSTAQSGTTAIQTFNITDTELLPGLYYIGVALDNATGTLMGFISLLGIDMECVGMAQQATAFALPATATFAAFAQTFIPLVTLHQKAP